MIPHFKQLLDSLDLDLDANIDKDCKSTTDIYQTISVGTMVVLKPNDVRRMECTPACEKIKYNIQPANTGGRSTDNAYLAIYFKVLKITAPFPKTPCMRCKNFH